MVKVTAGSGSGSDVGVGAAAAAFLSDEARWNALVARDSHAVGAFFYAVQTTGVYCRPGCPSRLPRRENVKFFPGYAQAEAAGFRPCQRCHPATQSLSDRHVSRVVEACRQIESADELPALTVLADVSGLSPAYFQRLFKSVMGMTPKAYALALRAKRLRASLSHSGSVTEAFYAAGFGSSGRFYEASGPLLGMRPARFRNGGLGVVIRFAVGQCALGALLVAATEQGVCAISLGDDPEVLLRELQDQFADAELLGGDAAFEAMVAKVAGFVEAPGLGLDLPLDIRGTVFQQQVWQVLREVPAGSTLSYAELARRVGASGATRAVAGACAANRIAVAIPCHRVVRQDGSLSGYRWGVERKRTLLESEQIYAAAAAKRQGRP